MPIHPIESKKIIQVKQHIPAFCSGLDPVSFQLEQPDQILKLDFIKDWEKTTGFDKWSVSTYVEDTYLLIALMTDGKFWVAAYMTGLTDEEAYAVAPRWIPPPKKEKKNDSDSW